MRVAALVQEWRSMRQSVLAVLVAVAVLGLFRVGFAVTQNEVKTAVAKARSSAREFHVAERACASLEKQISRLSAKETATKAALATARTELAASRKNAKKGKKSGFLSSWFASDPARQVAKLEEKLKSIQKDLRICQAELVKAKRRVQITKMQSKSNQQTADSLSARRKQEIAAIREKARKEQKSLRALQQAQRNFAAVKKTSQAAQKKLAALKQRVDELKKEKARALIAVQAKTKLATMAKDQTARELAVKEMRKAENTVERLATELEHKTNEVNKLIRQVEGLEQDTLQAQEQLAKAEQAYKPFAMEKMAAQRALELKAKQEKLAKEKRLAKIKKEKEAKRLAKLARKKKIAAEKERKRLAKERKYQAEQRRKQQVAAEKKRQRLAKKAKEEQARLAKKSSGSWFGFLGKKQVSAPKATVKAKATRSSVTTAPVKKASKVAKKAKKQTKKVVAKKKTKKAKISWAQKQKNRQAEIKKIRAERKAAQAKAAKAKAAKKAKCARIVSATRARQEKRQKAADNKITFKGAWPQVEQTPAATARAVAPKGTKYDICAVVVTGDRDAVTGLKNWSDYENDALYAPMSAADIESFRQRILKDLQDDGYVFATVSVYQPSLRLGFLKLRVHVGQKGNVLVKGNRWYTAKQVLQAASWQTGAKFNYRKLYSDLFDLNVRPDVRVNTKLKPHLDKFGRRIVDVELDVKDRFPIHGSLNLSNTGSKETSDWRVRTTLQHLNLTKHNDVLTVEWLTDPHLTNQVNAVSSSYYLPFGEGNSLTLYGGWSESDINDVAPELDVYGEGYYMGVQVSQVLKETPDYTMDASLGWQYQYTENANDLAGMSFDKRRIWLSMPSLTIGYAAKKFDRFAGRNYWSNQVMANFAGKFGASKNDKSTQQAALTDGDFVIDRFQFARLQKLFAGRDEPGKWTMFFKTNIQLASDAVVSSVQKGIGGVNSVRGYREREVLGDSGMTATLELRTPLIDNFIPGLKRSEEYRLAHPDDWKMHRLQFVTFLDYGTVRQEEPLPGEADTETFASFGAGLRLGLTRYSQIKFDYGVPFSETRESSSNGRGHLSLQLQF